MKLMKNFKSMFKNRKLQKSGLPIDEDGTYSLKERYPELGDTPVHYVLPTHIINFYTNIEKCCDAYLSGIVNPSELNEGYYDQFIDIEMHMGLKELERQRLSHQHTAKKIDREIKMAINKKRDEINRYEESLQKIQADIEKMKKEE